MSATKIGVKMAVDGDNEFKQAISNISASAKELESQMALVTSEYKNNANSQEALTAKSKVLSDQLQNQKDKSAKLEAALQNMQNNYKQSAEAAGGLKQKISDLESKLKDLENSTEDTTEEEAQLKQEIGELNTALGKQEVQAQKAEKKVAEYQTQINYSKIAEKDFNEEIQVTGKHLDEAGASADGCATSIDQYGDKAKEAGEQSEEFGNKSSGAVSGLATALAAAGVAATIKEITEAVKECTSASMEFESAVTGVYKTVDGTDEQLQGISDGIKELSLNIPATTTEIAGVAEAAGQLGIATDDILSFTEVMTNLGVATNLSAEEAASSLAKFANITQMSVDDYENLGSVIVALGNNFATTESDVVNMATGIASAGELANMSEANIMAFAAALSSLGLESQAGSTAVSKLIREFDVMTATGSDSLQSFADIAGMTADEFTQAWGEDAVSAVVAFISGLGDLDASGGSVSATLSDLGITETRLVDTIQRLASSGDLLTEAVSMSNSAWEENTALTTEAEQRYATTESKMQMLDNAVNLLKVSIGDALTPVLGDMAGGLTDATAAVTSLTDEHPELVGAITGVIAAMALFVGGLTVATLAMKFAAIAAAELNIALGPIAIAVAAVGAAVGILAAAYSNMEDETSEAKTKLDEFETSLESSREAFNEWKASFDEESENISSLVGTIGSLVDAQGNLISNSAADVAILESAVGSLNEAVPGLGLAFDSETNSLNMTSAAILGYVQAARDQEEAIAIADKIIDAEDKKSTAAANLAEAQDALTAAQERYNDAVGSGNQEEYDAAFTNYKKCYNAVETYEGALEELDGDLAANKDRLNELTGATGDAGNANETTAEKTARLSSELQTLQGEYDKAYEAAKESVEGQFKLTEEVDATVANSAANQKKAVDSQIQYWTEYNANLDGLRNREIEGIDTLVKKYSDGSTDSAAALAGLANASDEEIMALLGSIGQLGDTQATVEGTMADAETGAIASMQNIQNELNSMEQTTDKAMNNTKKSAKTGMDGTIKELDRAAEARTAGNNTAAGFVNSIRSKISEAFTAGAALSNASIAGINSVKGIEANSPSKKAEKSGVYVGQGVIGGMQSMEAKIKATGGNLGAAAISGIRSSLENFSFSGTAWGAEEALEKYKEVKSNIEHDRDMGLISEAAYYNKLLSFRNQYLKDYGNLSEWRSVTEAIYKYQSSLVKSTEDIYEELVDLIDYYLALDLITETEYYAKLTTYRDTYLGESTDAWKEATKKIYSYQKSIALTMDDMYKNLLDDLEHYYTMGLVSLEDYWERRTYLTETYIGKESDLYNSAVEALLKEQEEYYDKQVSTLDFYLALNLISEAEYYSQLEALRDTYLEENSDKWRTATKSLYTYQKSLLDTQLSDTTNAIETALDAQLAAYDEYLAERKAQIKDELAAEKERVSGFIDAINAEIAARKAAKTEANYEQAVADAQKKVDYLLAQLEYERDNEDAAELQKELIRAQEALADAQENFEYYLWEQEQNARIKELEAGLEATEAAATAEIEAIEAETEELKAAAKAAAEAAKEAATIDYTSQLTELVNYVSQLVAAAEASEAASQTGQTVSYDPSIDYAANMLVAETKKEFDYWADKRQQKINSEGITGVQSNDELYLTWLLLTTDYDKKTDYAALALSSSSEDEFWRNIQQRNAKIYGEDINSNSVASAQDLYSQWLASNSASTLAAETAALTAAATYEAITNNSTTNNVTMDVNNAVLSTGQLALLVEQLINKMAG